MADLMNWRALTTAINEIPPVPSMVLDLLFGTSEPHLAAVLDVDLVIGARHLAPFVNLHQPGVVVEKLAREMRTVAFPMIRIKKDLPAAELLLPRAPGAEVYVKGGLDQYKRQRIALELQDLKNRVDRTVEWMAAQAIQGGFRYIGDDLDFTIDFLVPDANKVTLVGGDKWDTTSADILGDIREYKRIVGRSGFPCDVAIAGTDVVAAMLANEQVLKLLDNRNVALGSLKVDNSNYLGRLAGVDFYEDNEEYVAVGDTTSTPMIPADVVVFTSTKARFVRHSGVIIDNKVDANVGMPYFAKSWEEDDPAVTWILAVAAQLPVPHNPGAVVVANVV